MTTKEASLLTGWTEQTVRSLCKGGRIGYMVSNKSRSTYYISPEKIREFFGWSQEELAKRIGDIKHEENSTSR